MLTLDVDTKTTQRTDEAPRLDVYVRNPDACAEAFIAKFVRKGWRFTIEQKRAINDAFRQCVGWLQSRLGDEFSERLVTVIPTLPPKQDVIVEASPSNELLESQTLRALESWRSDVRDEMFSGLTGHPPNTH